MQFIVGAQSLNRGGRGGRWGGELEQWSLIRWEVGSRINYVSRKQSNFMNDSEADLLHWDYAADSIVKSGKPIGDSAVQSLPLDLLVNRVKVQLTTAIIGVFKN